MSGKQLQTRTLAGALVFALAAALGLADRAAAQDQTRIVDSRTAIVQFNAGTYTFDEDAGTVTNQISLIARTLPNTIPPLRGFSVRVSTRAHSASSGDDYGSFSRRVTFSGGFGTWVDVGNAYEQEVRLAVRIVGDHLDEDDETFGLLLSAPNDPLATIGIAPADLDAASRCTSDGCESLVTIVDDDTRGVAIGHTGTLSVPEGGDATYSVTLETKPTDNVTVTPEVRDATDADVSVSQAVTFTPDNWSRPQMVRVAAAADENRVDGSAMVTHAVAGGDYGENGVTGASVAVREEDREADMAHSGDVTIATTHATALGGIDEVAFTVTRQVATDYDLDVPVTLSAGIIPADELARTVTIDAGSASTNLIVSTNSLDPDAVTGDVTATVGDGLLHDAGDPSAGSVRVYVGDTLLTVRLSSTDYELDENVGETNAKLSVIARTAPNVLAPVTPVQLVVDVQEGTAVSPHDYTARSEMVTLPAGSDDGWVLDQDSYMSEVPILVSIVDDEEIEGDEAFRLMLKRAPGLSSTVRLVPAEATAPPCTQLGCEAIVTIRDNDERVVVTITQVPEGTVLPDRLSDSPVQTIEDGSTFIEGELALFRLLLTAADGGPPPGGADVELTYTWHNESPIVPTSGQKSLSVFGLLRVSHWDGAVQILDNDVGNPDGTLTIRITGCERNGCVIGEPSEITVTIADDDGGPEAAPPGKPASPWTSCPDRGHSALDTGFKVMWEAPDFVGGAPIDHYELRYRTREFVDDEAVTGEWQAWPSSVVATSVTISGLETDTAYGVQVRAVNANGPGEWSLEGLGRTDKPNHICEILDELTSQ